MHLPALRSMPLASAGKLLFLLAIALFAFALRLDLIAARSMPGGDEGSWMQVASNVARGDGFVSRVKEHFFTGANDAVRHPEDCRHPFFAGLLAVVFSLAGFTFKNALLVVAGLGMLQAGLVFLLTRSLWNTTVALIAVALVLMSPFHLAMSTSVYAEMLFAAWFAALWWYATITNLSTGGRRFFILGIITGVGYLIRPNALFFVPAGVLEACLRGKDVRSRLMLSLLFIAGCIVTASPWLLRNLVVFHDPFFSWYGAGPWVGKFTDGYTLGTVAPTLSDYLRHHGLLSLVVRPSKGFWKLLHWVSFNDSGFIFALLPFAGYYAIATVMRALVKRNAFVLTGALISLGFSAWTATVADSSRFAFYLLPCIAVLAAAGVAKLGEAMHGRRRTVLLALVSMLILLPLVESYRFYLRSAGPPDTNLTVEIASLRVWLNVNTSAGDVVMSHTLCQLAFQETRLYSDIPCSPSDTLLEEYLHRYRIRYIVMGPGDRVFKDWPDRYWRFTKDSIEEIDRPSWLKPVFRVGRFRGYEVGTSSR
jgi:hypothetical protein